MATGFSAPLLLIMRIGEGTWRQFSVISTHHTLQNSSKQEKAPVKENRNRTNLHNSYTGTSNTEASFPVQCNSTFKAACFYLLFLLILEGNCETQNHDWNLGNPYSQSLRAPMVRYLEIESMPPVFLPVSCFSGPFPRWHCSAACIWHKQFKCLHCLEWNPPQILSCSSSEHWDHPRCCTVLLWSHTTLGKCTSTAGMM